MDKLATVASVYVLTITTKFVFVCMLTKAVQSTHSKTHTHTHTHLLIHTQMVK